MCEYPVETKKTYLSLYIEPGVKESLERQAKRERRSLSNLAESLLIWSQQWLAHAKNSQELIEWGPGSRLPRSGRVSDELQEQLIVALRTILDRAPSAAIEKVAEILTDYAGKYGDESERREARGSSPLRKAKSG
jgi:hypothetical protein